MLAARLAFHSLLRYSHSSVLCARRRFELACRGRQKPTETEYPPAPIPFGCPIGPLGEILLPQDHSFFGEDQARDLQRHTHCAAMAPASGSGVVISSTGEVKKKPVSHVSLGVGAFMQMFEVTTLGQPFEVLKTHMAGKIGILSPLRSTELSRNFDIFDSSSPWRQPSCGHHQDVAARRHRGLLPRSDPVGVDRGEHQGRRPDARELRGRVPMRQPWPQPGPLVHVWRYVWRCRPGLHDHGLFDVHEDGRGDAPQGPFVFVCVLFSLSIWLTTEGTRLRDPKSRPLALPRTCFARKALPGSIAASRPSPFVR